MRADIIYGNGRGVYVPGQTVDGHVKVSVTDSTKIEEINLQWLGHAIVSWSEGTGDDSTSYSDKETYFDTKMLLLEKKPYQHKNLKLLPGVYMYPFGFQLPLDIPNSYRGFSGFVNYEVTVTVVRPWAFNVSKRVPFTVISHLDLNTLPYANTIGIAEDEKTVKRCFGSSGPIRATITTDRLGYVPGEDIVFTAEIHNRSDTDLRPCQAALSMNVCYHAYSRITKGSYILCKLMGPEIPRGRSCLWEKQRLAIPPLPPSFLHGCKLIDIEYYISITVKPYEHSSSLFVPLMIVIGTIPLKTATNIIPQLEFSEVQHVKSDLSTLYPFYRFKSLIPT
ncbi:hypothetical protein CHS0354_032950 [Potamilus streckersoni]|uniref:Arrestin C-terminal-like domain-containing protein n=1 Tax=Potamilus streckersoni TaxID=2493646 RepID=A0AAE0SID3_9BIVA|nr:hypothetical protein CHS0354_032950 [Potamilus streckersoni]